MGTVGSNVIFAIGATGASATAGKFAMVGAAIVGVGKAVLAVQKQAEEFRMAFDRLSDGQVRSVMAMDKATAGFMDTMGLLKVQAKATEMGLADNIPAMEAMARLSLDISRKLGEGPDAMIARLERLTSAVGRGQTRTLKEFGIDLSTALRDAGKSTEDMAAAQDMALKMVIDRAQELSDTVGAENMREGFSRLQNDAETTIGLMWGSVANTGGGLAGAFDAVHGAMGAFNDLMMSPDTKDAMQDYIWSLQGISDAIGSAIKMWGLGANALTQFGDSFVLTVAKIKAQGMLAEAGRAAALGTIKGTGQGLQQTGGLAAMTRATIPEETGGGKRRGGGGGRRAKAEPVYDMEFSLEESVASEQEYMMGGAVSDARKRWQTKLMEWEFSELERKHETERNKELDAQMYIYDMKREMDAQNAQMHTENLGLMLGAEQQYIDQSLAIWGSGLQGKAELMSGFFHNISLLQNTESRKAFAIGKAAAISESVINTYLGAIKAYQAMAGIPYVGPFLGAAAAAAVTIAGAYATKMIAAQKFGGGGVTGIAGAGSPPGGPSSPGPGSYPAGTYGGGQETVINLTLDLDGETVHKSVVKANKAAGRNGQETI